MTPTSGLSEKEMAVLFFELGRMAFALPSISNLLGHEKMADTVRDYVDIHEEDEKILKIAKRYLKDLYLLNSKALIEKWGDLNGTGQLSEKLSKFRKSKVTGRTF